MEEELQPTITAAESLVTDDHKGRKILTLVFKTIIWGTLVDLFNSTFGVLLKYLKHFLLCLHYFWSPDIDRPPFDKFDFNKFCKHSFEAVVLTLVLSVFLVKVGVLAPTNEDMKDQLGSDLFQMGYEWALFLGFAITYFLLIVISITTGRIIRRWLTPNVTKKESDILMITFFNSFFSLTAFTALLIRCFVSFRDNTLEAIYVGVSVILFLICITLTVFWACRFIYLNGVRGWRMILFFLSAVPLYTVMFTTGGLITAGLLYIV